MKNILALVFGALILAMVAGVSADILPAPSLSAIVTNQTPYPAHPGDVVSFEVEIQNTGYGDIQNLVAELNLTDPLRLLPGEERIKTFGIIASRSSVKTTYKVHVDSEAISSDYTIKLVLYNAYDASQAQTVADLAISVQGQPNLVIDNVQLSPEKLSPGGTGMIAFRIKNVGTGAARGVELMFPNTTFIQPLLSMGDVFIGDIPPGVSKSASVGISIDPTAEQMTYVPVITLSYRDESNTAVQDLKSIGIPVTGSVDLEIIKIEPAYDRGTIKINVANKGTTSAKAVEAKLIINGNLVDVDYVSELKENRETTFDFPLVLKGTGQLVLSYVGPGIEKNNVTKDVVFNYTQPSGSDGTGFIIIIVIVAVVVLYLWRRGKKKKK